MANTIITLKKSATPSQVPGDLANGELAINYADGKLFYKDSTGSIQEISSGGNTFSTINAAGTFVTADLPNDILSIDQGSNIIITGDSINDKITIAADLTAANAWANTKLSNGTVTLNGALTTTGQIYANQQITVYPLGSGEGGEIQLLGSDSYPDWSIDSYQNSLRFFTLNAGSQIVSFFNGGTGNVKVGINTGNPGYEIDVVGDVNVTGAFRVNGTPITTGGGSMDYPYANSVGIAGNTYTNAVGIAANTWANTKLANTSGVMFEGTLNIKNNLWIGNNITNVSSIIFNTSTNRTPTTPGELTWSQDDSTLRFDMDTTTNVIGHIGQDVFYYVKNQSGSSIAKGTVVRFAGTLGASGRLLIAPAIANNSYPSKYVMGVTATSIANGDDGFVLSQGKLRQIDTSMFSEGDILYLSPTTAGAFSNTMPTAPNNKITIAAVVKKDNTVGAIEVRVTLGSKLNEDELVELDTLTGGDVLVYNGTTGRFENEVQLSLNAGSVNGLSANTIMDSANGYARVFANSVGTAGNANLSVATIAANTYADSVGVAANNFAGSMSNSVNAYTSATYSTITFASTAYDKANAANVLAKNAYDYANTIAGAGGVAVSTTAPSSPTANSLWWNSTYGRLLIYYSDGDSSQWVDTNPSINVDYFTTYTAAAFDKANGASDYSNTVSAASNTWANTIGAASNTWANTIGAASNTWANTIGAASNTWANTIGAASNTWSNTKLANTSGTYYNGSLLFPSGNVGVGRTIAGYEIDVVGTVNASSFLINGSSISAFPSGTSMLFVQTSAPTGWTKSTTHNDKVLRVVSGSASSGGSTAFSTVFASKTPEGTLSGGAVASYTLTSPGDIPSHTHVEQLMSSTATMTAAGTRIGGSGTGTTNRAATSSTQSTGSGGGHSHSFTQPTFTGNAMDFAVQYVDVIIATKD